VQADKTKVATQIPFWGCPVMSFEAQLPFYGVREDFAASERDPSGPFCSPNEFFQKPPEKLEASFTYNPEAKRRGHLLN
jgi:hypothetical protein